MGDHSTNDLNNWKTKNYYLGGGDLILKAVKKYRKINFKKEILEFFPTKQEAFDAQEKYIIQFNTLISNGYNISPTGGLGVRGCHSLETIKKMSKSKKGKKLSQEHIQNIIKAKLNRTEKEKKETNKKISLSIKGKNTWTKGKKQSIETIEKKRKSHIGKKQTKETIEKIKNKLRGQKRTQKQCENISKSHKGKK